MSLQEAKLNLRRWRRWATCVRSRWEPDTPLARLAQRRLLAAELRYLELLETERQKQG